MSIRPASGLLAFAVAGLLAGHALGAETRLAPATAWNVQSDFASDARARTNLSGAACAPTTPPFASCLIVNDDKSYAQLFSLDGTTIVPGQVIRLKDDDTGDPDAEGAAYADGSFYVVGSHGRSRYQNRPNDSSYVVFRIPVDAATGRPTFRSGEEVDLESSGRLREAITNSEPINAFYDKPLANDGVNIEGIAAKDGRLYLGLRGPSVDSQGFILSVDAAAVFTTDRNLDARVIALGLGDRTGIRDLAPVEGGLLVLSGPVSQEAVEPAVFFWNDKAGALTRLGEIAVPAHLTGERKAETLLVLEDSPGKPWRVLVLFDGPANGAPTEYLIPRP